MLEIQQLSAGYPSKPVLHDISLSIPAGKVTVVLGPNGCGKSTLLKTICGILPANGGQILLEGQNILTLPPRQLAKKVAYLAQSHPASDITAYRLVLHGRFPHLGYPRRYRKEDHACAQVAMEQMGVWEHRGSPIEQLSGGERQKVYLAMALAQGTPIILLDEPTTYLDIAHQLQTMHLAQDLARQGKTVLLVLHDLPHAFQMADRLILMADGKVVAEGTPEEIFLSRKIEEVFRICLCRAQTGSGWRYYCEEK